MLISFIRITILYIVVLFAIRILGKRQISEYQPFELVVTIMIADIITEPLSDVNVPLFNGLIPAVVFIFLQILISFLTYKNEFLRNIICGKPDTIINDGQIDQKKMKDMLIGIDDLCEQLRNNDVIDINKVSYLILEANGQPSIIEKNSEGCFTSLIKYGRRINENLREANVTNIMLDKEIKRLNIHSDKDIFWAYHYNKKIYIIRKDDFK